MQSIFLKDITNINSNTFAVIEKNTLKAIIDGQL